MTLQDEKTHYERIIFLNASFNVIKFPSDFDIFLPFTVTRLLWIQYFTNGFSVAASLCAISHSWCGIGYPFHRRECQMSRRYFIDIAEHSICHPGNPSPTARQRIICRFLLSSTEQNPQDVFFLNATLRVFLLLILPARVRRACRNS